MRLRSASPSLALALALALAPAATRAAFAQTAPPPAQRATVYSAYEAQTIDQVLASLHETRDPDPDGKTIERVEVVPIEVFEARDDPFPAIAFPRVLNALHVTSRTSVIQRELLVREGEPYRQVLVDETIRNLRRLPQLSVTLAFAIRGSAPDRVGVIVITKDVWSLRLGWNVELTAGGLELFDSQPAEWNFLGTHQTLNGHFAYQPLSYTFGLGYVAPRLGDSRVATVVSADVFVDRVSGAVEGSQGSVLAGQPLYSGLVDWAWDASVAWQDAILRRYSNAHVFQYVAATGGSVPSEYRSRQYVTTYELTRSLGWKDKHDVTMGAGIDRSEYLVDFPGVDPRTVADFVASSVPVSDTRVGPFAQYHAYTKRYVRVIDFDTLAMQEDYALGHDVVLRVYPSFRALGATRDVLGLYGAVQYTVAVRDGLFRASFESRTEPEVHRIADAAVQPTAHLVSPTIAGLGRIVLDGTFVYRWRNSLNTTAVLGGGDRLRGYPTNFFFGPNYIAYNVELRSRPVEIFTCQLAGVAFFDAGDAYRDRGDFAIHQSVGFGVRALFPWLDRIVFRADIGFPIERTLDASGVPIPPFGFVVSFSQAFPTPTVSPAPVLPTGQ
jgi:hypothetical protein